MLLKRRDFVLSAAATASAGLIWSAQRLRAQAQEAPPETTTIRLAKTPSLCVMPQYVVDELLAAEGHPCLLQLDLRFDELLRHFDGLYCEQAAVHRATSV